MFGEKNKIDTNYTVKDPIKKMTFVYSKNVHAVEFNDLVNIEGEGNMGGSLSGLNVKTVNLKTGQHIVGVFGQYYKDNKDRKVVSWFSFIVTPYKHCGLSCCNPNGANGISKVPVLKRSQTNSYARHSMLLPNSPSGPNTRTPSTNLETLSSGRGPAPIEEGNATMRTGFSKSFRF